MHATSRDDGFTLIELLMTMVLMGIVMAIAVAGFSHYSDAHAQEGSARSLQSALRQAQQRAVTEGRAMCVQFTAASYTVWRTACDATSGTKLEGPYSLESSKVHLALAPVQSLLFTPRGTATWGTITSGATAPGCGNVTSFDVNVTRDGSSKTYQLCVAALTGRVDLHG
ncbi:GspH/FimT family pseudopilin [Nocardioides sp. HB32]